MSHDGSGGVSVKVARAGHGGGSANAGAGFKKSTAAAGTNDGIGPHNFKDHFDSDILDYVCEDVRLSTLQRKLVRESNTLVAHALACQVI